MYRQPQHLKLSAAIRCGSLEEEGPLWELARVQLLKWDSLVKKVTGGANSELATLQLYLTYRGHCQVIQVNCLAPHVQL